MNEWNEIIGNERVAAFLKKSIQYKKISHAYIFDGIDGVGKCLFANAFAKSLQCKAASPPCHVCSACKSFDSHNNPDVIYVLPQKNNLSVDDIREQVNKTVAVKPYANPYKIYIIDSADKMSISAQNALLKTIEEPPAQVILLLLADNAKLFLETILSRVVMLKLQRIPVKQIFDHLIRLGFEQSLSEVASLYAMGSIGRALKIAADEDYIQMRQKMIGIAASIRERDLVELFLLYTEFDPLKEKIFECLDVLYMWYRDILLLKAVSLEHILQKSSAEWLLSESEYYSLGNLFTILDSIEKSKRYLSQNANYQLTIEMLIMKIKENTQRRNV